MFAVIVAALVLVGAAWLRAQRMAPLHDVNVRVMGDFALVHARTTFRMADGRAGQSRYTDTWARRDGRWVAIAAQITRY